MSPRMHRPARGSGLLPLLLVALIAACSSDESNSDPLVTVGSQGGSGGAQGGKGGGGGASSGGSGSAGAQAGSAQAGGAQAGGAQAGSAQAGAGQAGGSGDAGQSGQAGSGGEGQAGEGQSGAAGADAGSGGADAGGAAGEGQGGSEAGGEAGQGGASGAAGAQGGSGGSAGSAPGACGCLLGEGPYCGGRAKAEAAKAGCTIAQLAGHENDLLKCDNGKWSVLEDCASNKCDYDASSLKLDDACKLPVCDCFVQVAYCGSGAAKIADQKGCAIPLLPEHNGDILYCPGGKWTVKQDCNLGCVEAPSGTPDYCKSASDYKMPFDCGTTRTCSNGNHTSTHTGKDEYAYDFAMPIGTTVRAMRSGKVLRVRNVSPSGSACYNSGSPSCINLANTVEVLHSDGTVGLYMHLSKGTVSVGAQVQQGDVIGKSGNSGWSTGPHTHVQVQKNCGIWWCQSIPFKFVEDSTISAGTSVKSKNCP